MFQMKAPLLFFLLLVAVQYTEAAKGTGTEAAKGTGTEAAKGTGTEAAKGTSTYILNVKFSLCHTT